jgi:hypothetical protein
MMDRGTAMLGGIYERRTVRLLTVLYNTMAFPSVGGLLHMCQVYRCGVDMIMVVNGTIREGLLLALLFDLSFSETVLYCPSL